MPTQRQLREHLNRLAIILYLSGGLEVTTLWSLTIDADTLEGTYRHEKVMTGMGTVTTSTASGPSRLVLNADGSVTMTVDAAPITDVHPRQGRRVRANVEPPQ